MELTGGVNSMTWQSEKITPGGNFLPLMYITGNLSFRGDISKSWSYSFNLERDNIFHNTFDFRFKTRTDYFGFEFGAFLGLTDTFEAPEIGILGSIEGIWPKILFVSVGGSSSIGTNFSITGDNFRESAEAKLGFWLPFAIPVLSASTKNFTENNGVLSIRNNLKRYQLSIEFFGKTSPVTLRVDGGYQILSRTYLRSTEKTDELRSFFAGLDFQFSVSKFLRFVIGGEMPFAVRPTAPLTSSGGSWTMFKAYGGMIIRFF